MKKFLILTLISASLALPAFGDIIYPDGNAPSEEPYQIKKLMRGIGNIVLFAAEIPKAMFDTTQTEGVLSTDQLTALVTRGPYNAFKRLYYGAYDIATLADEEHKDLPEHLTPETIGVRDLMPWYNTAFSWETIDTPAYYH